MKKIALLCVIAMLCLLVNAQLTINPLKIGDTVSDITFNNVVGYPTKTARLSDFKGKPLILDFWATWCGSCLKGIEKLQDLSDAYAGQLQVLLINADTTEDAKKAQTYFSKRTGLTKQQFSIPYALKDTMAARYFPHETLPHYAWVDKDGIVRAITSQQELTPEHIKDFVAGKPLDLPVKNDDLKYSPEKPLLAAQDAREDQSPIYRSAFTRYQEGLGTSINQKMDTSAKVYRYTVVNYSLKKILRMAYPELSGIPLDRFLSKSTISSNALDSPYCYELITPPIPMSEVRTILREDLKRTLGIVAAKELITYDCYVAEPNNNFSRLVTKGGEPAKSLSGDSKFYLLKNYPATALAGYLTGLLGRPVFVEKTGGLPNIDLVLPEGFAQWPHDEIVKYFNDAGLSITACQRELKSFVIYNFDHPSKN